MRYDPEYTAAYYDGYAGRESARWSTPHMQIQRELYLRHLRARVRPGDRVLDAGSGPGTFTRTLLELGARVTCLDLSPVQLEACKLACPEVDELVLGSIVDLSRFEDGAFDVVISLGGPLSYCLDQAPRAASELVRVTRPHGQVGVSVMSLLGAIHAFLPGVLALPVAVNRQILADGELGRAINAGHECHMYRPAELEALLSGAGLRQIELFASGWLTAVHPSLPEHGSELWQLLVEAEMLASREAPAAGTHIVAWGHTQRGERP